MCWTEFDSFGQTLSFQFRLCWKCAHLVIKAILCAINDYRKILCCSLSHNLWKTMDGRGVILHLTLCVLISLPFNETTGLAFVPLTSTIAQDF